MIERHYFQDELIKSYDFNFGFVIPNSTNTWDAVYEIPSLPPSLIDAMITNPFQCKSDTFYFVGEELVMHHKVSYRYIRKDGQVSAVKVQSEPKCEEDSLVDAFVDAKLTDDEFDIQSEAKSSPSNIFVNDFKESWSKDTEY